MKFFKWSPAGFAEFEWWSPFTRFIQYRILGDIPADKTAWETDAFLCRFVTDWAYEELRAALRGYYPVAEAFPKSKELIAPGVPCLVDVEMWEPHPPQDAVGTKTPPQVADARREAWLFTATHLYSTAYPLGFYGVPTRESWQGISKMLLAGDVPPAAMAVRWRRWHDVLDQLVGKGFFQHVNLLCPDMYPRALTPRQWLKSADILMDECQRRYEINGCDVIPFISYRWHGRSSGGVIPRTFWQTILEWLADNVCSCVIYDPPTVEIGSWYYEQAAAIATTH